MHVFITTKRTEQNETAIVVCENRTQRALWGCLASNEAGVALGLVAATSWCGRQRYTIVTNGHAVAPSEIAA